MQKTALSLSLKLCAFVPKDMENNIGRTSIAMIMDFMQDIIFHTRSDVEHMLTHWGRVTQICVYTHINNLNTRSPMC